MTTKCVESLCQWYILYACLSKLSCHIRLMALDLNQICIDLLFSSSLRAQTHTYCYYRHNMSGKCLIRVCWNHIHLRRSAMKYIIEGRTSIHAQFFFNGSSSPFRAQTSYSVPQSSFTDSRTPWASDQPVARPLPTHRTIRRQNKRIHTPNIHASSGIRTHDPRVRASEVSSCLRPRGYCDRLASERAKTVHALDRAVTVTG
jgi:hypothetical protein